ncbi:helix-turn-helix transcriptional regulator [candidate division KSB1 bacterium]|nr:helix-turn-helix transcriptional regulator [candidate division KSB1 bacterium]
MFLNWNQIFMLIGAAQAALLALLIFQKYDRLYANRFLGVLMVIYAMILTNLIFSDYPAEFSAPHLFLIPLGLTLLIGPLNYLYANFLLYPMRKFYRREICHFIAFLIYELTIVPDFFKSKTEILQLFYLSNSAELPLRFLIFNWVVIIIGLVYLILILPLLKRYEHYSLNIFSNIERVKLNWLRNITWIGIAGWSIYLIENILFLLKIDFSQHFNLSAILGAAFIYGIGYWGLLKSEIFVASEDIDSINQLSLLGDENQQQLVVPPSGAKYEKSGLSPQKAKVSLENLLYIMETEKPYKNANLTLTQLAEQLSISSHNLSEILNTQLNQNFFDFINQYRIKAVKADLADPEKQNWKILAIAFDAGFNAKTSFNTIFKKFTGMTPSEYRDKMIASEKISPV